VDDFQINQGHTVRLSGLDGEFDKSFNDGHSRYQQGQKEWDLVIQKTFSSADPNSFFTIKHVSGNVACEVQYQDPKCIFFDWVALTDLYKKSSAANVWQIQADIIWHDPDGCRVPSNIVSHATPRFRLEWLLASSLPLLALALSLN